MLAAIGALCWSFGGALVRLTDGLDAWQIIFYRSTTLLVCMMGWLVIAASGGICCRLSGRPGSTR